LWFDIGRFVLDYLREQQTLPRVPVFLDLRMDQLGEMRLEPRTRPLLVHAHQA
jgi:hypothetical protein